MKKIAKISNRRTSIKIALFERSEFAILEVRDLENFNFCNEIFDQWDFVILFISGYPTHRAFLPIRSHG